MSKEIHLNSDRVNRWLTLGANLGVLVGILLLVVELDQNRDMMRSQIRYQVFQDEANYNLSVATNRDLVELIHRAGQGEQLVGADRTQNFIRLLAYFRIQENIHYQYRQGLFDQSEYENIKRTRHAFVSISSETAGVWCRLRQTVTAEFRKDVDEAFAELDCEDP